MVVKGIRSVIRIGACSAKWEVTVNEGGPDDDRESPLSATLYLKVGRNGLYACLTQGDDCTRAHDVVIDVCKLPWQSASAGLGAGFVAWTVKDAASWHSLLGFSTLGEEP